MNVGVLNIPSGTLRLDILQDRKYKHPISYYAPS